MTTAAYREILATARQKHAEAVKAWRDGKAPAQQIEALKKKHLQACITWQREQTPRTLAYFQRLDRELTAMIQEQKAQA